MKYAITAMKYVMVEMKYTIAHMKYTGFRFPGFVGHQDFGT